MIIKKLECKYDLLIKDGRVIDPSNDIDEIMDVVIRGKKIAEIDKDIHRCSYKREK